MVSYAQIIRRLPEEWQMTMVELVEALEGQLRQELAVRREDIEALSAEVRELTWAQMRAEERSARLEEALARLAEAQARTEVAIQELRDAQARTEAQVRALAEAQARTEVAIQELRDAQARTEARVQALAEAQARTEVAIQELRDAQARTEAQVQALAEAQARTEERVTRLEEAVQRLAEAQARTEERVTRLEETVQRLAEAQARTEQMLQALIATQQKFEERLQRLEVRVGQMDGDLLEIRYERRATAYFGRVLRQVRVVEVSELLDTLEARLTPEEVDELLNLDLLVVGRPRRGETVPEGREVWLAVEISALVDTEDVKRAVERAALLRKAGHFVIPTVAGREATPYAETAAQEQEVLLFRDGRVDFWDRALARWGK